MSDNLDNTDPDKKTSNNGLDGRGRFAQGNPGGPGRPPGRKNTFNRRVRDEILTAYERRGGVEWLVGLPDALFVKLLTKLLPKEIDVHGAQITALEVAEQVEAMRRTTGGGGDFRKGENRG